MEQKSSVSLGCTTWTCACSAAHLPVTVVYGTACPVPCTHAQVLFSLAQTGLGGSTALLSCAAGRHCSPASARSCVVSSAVLLWPEGTQLVAAGQPWYLVCFSFLVFHLIPFFSLLCVAPSPLSPSASHCVGAIVSLSLPFHLPSSILALTPGWLPVPWLPWSPAQAPWHEGSLGWCSSSSCLFCALLQICPWPLVPSLLYSAPGGALAQVEVS